MSTVVKHLGLEKALRNGGRFGIPNNLVKTINIPDMDTLRSYMDLYMKKEDKATWDYILKLAGKIDSVQVGATGEGIDYAAVTISDLGKYLPFTFFIYSSPDNKLNLYLPTRGNMLMDKKPIQDCSSLSATSQAAVDVLRDWKYAADTATSEERLARSYQQIANFVLNKFYPGELFSVVFDSCDHLDLLSKGILKVGPTNIVINYGGDTTEIVSNMDLMVEDFSHRVVIKSAATSKKSTKSAPVIGGTDKELLYIHPDAENWLSHLFGWKSKGVFTGMTSDNPDVSMAEAKKMCFEDCLFQFDKGVLREDSREGDRDSAVWRCRNWDEVWFEDAVIEKIKKLYPGIQPENIFLSDED